MQFLPTGNTLMASVGTATSDTITNLLPVVAVVGGIVLAFIGIRYIVGLLKSTGKR